MMPRRLTCRRKGCEVPRQRWQFLCSSCWAKVPGWLQAAITRAGKGGRHVLRDQLRADAIAHLNGTRPAVDPRTNPAHTAAICGDREGGEY